VDLHYGGIAFGRGSDRMNMEFPEAVTERKMLFARKPLVSKKEHLMTEECPVDLIEGCIIQLSKVDALNLSTDVGGQGLNLDLIELHCSLLTQQPPIIPFKKYYSIQDNSLNKAPLGRSAQPLALGYGAALRFQPRMEEARSKEDAETIPR
jgi:hypothetical protein